MNFEDEPYVRVYKRKTVTTKLIGWEGRMVLRSLLLEVDRAGILDLDGMDPAEALAALDEMPLEHVRVGMGRLLDRGVVVVQDGVLFVPRYMDAQEAKQSDAQRQRESRARRAAELRVTQGGLVTKASTPGPAAGEAEPSSPEPSSEKHVTNGDGLASQPVTKRHDRSHAVTRGHPSSAQPSNTEQEEDLESSDSAGPGPAPLKLKPPATAGATKRTLRWRRVPADWKPKPEHVGLAMQLGVPLDEEVEKFRDHEFKNTKTDPDACFRTWLKNSLEFRRSTIGNGLKGGSRAGDTLDQRVARAAGLRALEGTKALP